MFFNQRHEIRRCVASQGRLAEVRIGGDEIVRAGMDVGEVASSAAGNGDLLADAVRVLEYHHFPAPLSSFNRAEKTCCSASDNYNIMIHSDCQFADCRLKCGNSQVPNLQIYLNL